MSEDAEGTTRPTRSDFLIIVSGDAAICRWEVEACHQALSHLICLLQSEKAPVKGREMLNVCSEGVILLVEIMKSLCSSSEATAFENVE